MGGLVDVADVMRSVRLPSSRFADLKAGVFATLLVALSACDRAPTDQPEPLEGADLVTGSSLARHGLLVISSTGGVAEFRSVEDPSVVRWTGRLTLPATTAAHSLGSAAVIRHEAGASLYRPSASPETLTPLPDVPGHARWIGSAEGGAFVASGWALAVTPSGSMAIRAEGEILWAAPAAGGRVVALVEAAGGPQLAVWDAGAESPTVSRAIGTRGPIVLTGWGSQVVTTAEDGRSLVTWSVPELESSEVFELEAPPVLLATSPSHHRLFAASSSRPWLLAIDRYDWEQVGSTSVDVPPTALRTSLTGDRVVGFDGSASWAVEAGETHKLSLPGEWRADLPIALPTGAILVSTADGVRRVSSDGADLGMVDGPADGWWLPFRWGPRLPVTAEVVAPEDTIDEAQRPPTSDRRIGLLTMGTVAGRAVAAPRPRSEGGAGERAAVAEESVSAATPSSGLMGGFYAVATSSRQLTNLGRLRQSLEGSGYSTHVLRRVDEANDTWYRLLVGPYSSRPAAEAVARELRRERGIDAWIHEVAQDQADERP